MHILDPVIGRSSDGTPKLWGQKVVVVVVVVGRVVDARGKFLGRV
ncbi:hypothetical protein E2C01_063183 [Portunus trituberculatus]|uniref:Uncharacterized protein n=1 Tax=Portunus trituberculatus TaxID=210409 RepID=A0A5B7H9T6_PORTR|nr:hypothetical protein [Portunus trituberculatus]